MIKIGETVQAADWKSEKHVPVIDCKEVVKANEVFKVEVTVGKQIPHPNTTEHHIRRITLFFKPEGDKFTYEVGHFNFNSHGESTKGPNTGPVYTDPSINTSIKIGQAGTLIAVAYCNIHGLWESSKEIRLA
jgi:desulfoferrodoxin ferrous iron-binding domain